LEAVELRVLPHQPLVVKAALLYFHLLPLLAAVVVEHPLVAD
jgi:hypothetical protein|tara:strand:- start:122 stop:247 length:126 start_codon:yes stop_codon:yes gene_type:complete